MKTIRKKRRDGLFHGKTSGFTMAELMISIGVIAILISIGSISIFRAYDQGKISDASTTAQDLARAVSAYYNDLGFYPPDTNRGVDPGLLQRLPSTATLPSCNHCPANWPTIVAEKWDGPYIERWPDQTPWHGEYEYNYWPSGANRGTCSVAPAAYIGIEGIANGTSDPLDDENKPRESAEIFMIRNGQDSSGTNCLTPNGEIQVIIKYLITPTPTP